MKKTHTEMKTEIRELELSMPSHRAPGDGSVSIQVTATASAIARKYAKLATR